MTNLKYILITAVAVCACRGRDSHQSEKSSAPAAAAPVAFAGTQTDLAREIDDADKRGTWTEVRQKWQGRELHWKVTRQRLLCRTAEACHVAAFPIQRPATSGWMPALAFAPGEFAKLDAACGSAEQCELEVVGTLRELVVSPELPTSLKFADVRVMAAVPERV